MTTKNRVLIIGFGAVLLLTSLGNRCGGGTPPGPPVITITSLPSGGAGADDCDTIRLTRSDGRAGHPGSVVIRLATGSGSPWWKEINCEVISTRVPCGRLHANDGPSTATGEIFVPSVELRDVRLIFIKPKVLGVATEVYQMIGLEPLANSTALFTWDRDRCG